MRLVRTAAAGLLLLAGGCAAPAVPETGPATPPTSASPSERPALPAGGLPTATPGDVQLPVNDYDDLGLPEPPGVVDECTLESSFDEDAGEILFATNSAEIDQVGRENLLAWARAIADRSVQAGRARLAVVVIGHTDRVGDDEPNLELSRARAEAGAAVLRAGFAETRSLDVLVTSIGKGETQASGPDGVPRAADRRLDVQLDVCTDLEASS